MDIRQAADSDRDKWNRFIADYPTGDLLQSFEWGIIKSRSGGWTPIRLLATEGSAVVGAMSILKRKLPRLNKSIFYAPRGPVADLANRPLLEQMNAATAELAREHSAILLKIDPPVLIDDTTAHTNLTAVGYRPAGGGEGFGGTQPKCVMQLDIRPTEDELMAAFKPKTRYNIKLAEKKGVSVRQTSSKEDLRKFYDILLETAARDGFLVRGFGYYETMLEVLGPPEYARLFLAEFNNEAVSGALCFYMGDRCWYTYGASSNSHRNVMPNYLMQWRMIQHAKSVGCGLYDFRGVSPQKTPTPGDHLQGLNRFKEGFGAQYAEYIGEYDLPFSNVMYWLWKSAAPGAANMLKRLKRSRQTAATEA
jgi:peptidoglycan pentaglycine glycine transferase (the first glycine)